MTYCQTMVRSAVGTETFRRLGLVKDHVELVKQIRRGFRVGVIEKLANALGVPKRTLLQITKIAPPTLTRRRKSASRLLSPQESDRVYHVAGAYSSAVQLFEGEAESARRCYRIVRPAVHFSNGSCQTPAT